MLNDRWLNQTERKKTIPYDRSRSSSKTWSSGRVRACRDEKDLFVDIWLLDWFLEREKIRFRQWKEDESNFDHLHRFLVQFEVEQNERRLLSPIDFFFQLFKFDRWEDSHRSTLVAEDPSDLFDRIEERTRILNKEKSRKFRRSSWTRCNEPIETQMKGRVCSKCSFELSWKRDPMGDELRCSMREPSLCSMNASTNCSI